MWPAARIDGLNGGHAVALAVAAHRLRVPALQPAAGADGRAQRRAAAAADASSARPSAASASRIALKVVGLADRASTTRGSSRAGRNSASASRARSSPTRRCCCATSPPAISTARPATRSSTCCRRSTASTARRSSWSRTIRTPPSAPDGRSHLEKGVLLERPRHEVPAARLEEHLAAEDPHDLHAGGHLHRLRAVRVPDDHSHGVRPRRRRRRPGSAGADPQDQPDQAAADFVSAATARACPASTRPRTPRGSAACIRTRRIPSRRSPSSRSRTSRCTRSSPCPETDESLAGGPAGRRRRQRSGRAGSAGRSATGSRSRPHLAAEERRGQCLGVQPRRHLRRRARLRQDRPSSSATTISTRTGNSARGSSAGTS